MFTGLIQQTGKVISIQSDKNGGRLVVLAPPSFSKGVRRGESVAVDGCCLTVVKKKGRELVFDLSKETLRKTTIGSYRKGQIVNLERALRPSDRMGGHFVLGHIDTVGKIKTIKKRGTSQEWIVQVDPLFSLYLIDKGSVAVDGVSLTVCQPTKRSFKVAVIPHTLKATNLGFKKPGDCVNLEGDVMGKYALSLILWGKKVS